MISYDNYTLIQDRGCAGATQQLLDGNDEIVYSADITDEMDNIVLLSILLSSYKLLIVCSDITF